MRERAGWGATALILMVLASLEGGCGGIAVVDWGDTDGAEGGGGVEVTTSNATTVVSGATSSTSVGAGVGGASSGAGAGGMGGAVPEGCPPSLPDPGPCAPDGLFCDYGGFCNSVSCENGSWAFPLC